MTQPPSFGNNVINLSSMKLGTSEYNVLEKGLNFIPTPREITKIPILEAATKFSRRLKLAYHFRNSQNHVPQKFIEKSSWTPNDKDMPSDILDTVNKIHEDISNLPIPKEQNNLSPSEIQALSNLRNNQNIIIKPADKGAATVVMNKQSYINEGYRQLNDERYYKKITTPIFMDTSAKIDEILQDLQERHFISDKQYHYLKPPLDPRPRHFYMLPKIHKPVESWPTRDMPAGRPIVSDVCSESYKISEYIDHFLKPLASKHESYLKDTSDFLNKLKQVQVNSESLLITMDVSNVYTNIDPHEGGMGCGSLTPFIYILCTL